MRQFANELICQFVNEFYHHNVHKRLIKKEVLWELPLFDRDMEGLILVFCNLLNFSIF